MREGKKKKRRGLFWSDMISNKKYTFMIGIRYNFFTVSLKEIIILNYSILSSFVYFIFSIFHALQI